MGGLNEKIEGYFRVCKEIGLDGKQGVLLPARNMRHLMLGDEIIDAVAAGQFEIATMNNIAEGILHVTGHTLAEVNRLAEASLADFKLTLEKNIPQYILNKS